MLLKATAKTPGPCCLLGCTLPGTKIYEGTGLRVLACTEGHAKAVVAKIEALNPGLPEGEWRAGRDAALRLFNAVRPVVPNLIGEDDDFELI